MVYHHMLAPPKICLSEIFLTQTDNLLDNTITIMKLGTPKLITLIYLKMGQFCSTVQEYILEWQTE